MLHQPHRFLCHCNGNRIALSAAERACFVQDLYHFPFIDKWYQGEKMWGLHEAAIKSGALWQVLWFIGLLEIPFLLKLANGSVDGSGDIGFDPLGLKEGEDFSANQVRAAPRPLPPCLVHPRGVDYPPLRGAETPERFGFRAPWLREFRACSARGSWSPGGERGRPAR